MYAFIVLSLFTIFITSPIPVRADDVFSTYNVVLQGTRTFEIDITDNHVPTGVAAHGTVFYWGVINEVDKNYDYFIIGVKYIRYGGFGNTPSNSLGGLYSKVLVYDYQFNNVYSIDYEPVYKVPLSGGTVSVGTGGAYVSFSLETNGYDYGYRIPSSGSTYYGGFKWEHYYTKADQDWWNKKAGAVCVKVPESNGNIVDYIAARVWLYYYVWNFWTGYISNWYDVTWNEGWQGAGFHLTDPTPNN